MLKLDNSPLRKHIEIVGNKPSIFDEEESAREILQDVVAMSEALHHNGILNIAVMGEVNAGKSTFINAIVGKKVTYTDVLEATATISEIIHSDIEYARIIWKDKSPEKLAIDAMLDWTEEMLEEADGDPEKTEEIFSRIEKVEIGLCQNILNSITLVDTPGLVTITDTNKNLTNKYVKETDYIIWILDKRNLGAKTVNECIEKVHLTGKPIIGVVNKVDSSDSYSEIKDFVTTQFKDKFMETYIVSSQKAYEAILKNDDEGFNASGIKDVVDYIEYLNEDSEAVQKDSVESTKYKQLMRDLEVHQQMLSVIRSRKGRYDSDMTHLLKINDEAKKSIIRELQHWYNYELFAEEKSQLLAVDDEPFERLLNKYANGTYLVEVFRNKYDELAGRVREKWGSVISSLKNESIFVDIDFSFERPLESGEKQNSSPENEVVDGMRTGAILGVAFAGYSAWLGPAAAAVTFAGALLPCAIPLAIGGAALGLYNSKKDTLFSTQQLNNEKIKIVEKLHTEIKRIAKDEIKQMKNELIRYADDCLEGQCKNINQTIAEQLNFSYEEEPFKKFENEMNIYMTELEQEIEKHKDQKQERYDPE